MFKYLFFLKKHRTCNVLLITNYEHVSNVELYRWTAETVLLLHGTSQKNVLYRDVWSAEGDALSSRLFFICQL